MGLPDQLEVVAHGLTAVLGVWLGLTVVTRSQWPGARVFFLLALTLAIWSSSVIVQRLPTAGTADAAANALEELAAAIGLAGTAHFALVIASQGRPGSRRLGTVGLLYALNIMFALPTILNPALPIEVGPPNLGLGPIPGDVLGWARVMVRLLSLVLAAAWLLGASRRETAHFRRGQLRAALATVVTGGLGASLRFLPVVGEADPWIGVSLVTLAVVLAAYAVFSVGIFFGHAVAGRAFRTSVVGGLVLFLVLGGLFALDTASRTFTGLDLPFFTALGLVIAIAVYEPMSVRVRALAAGGPAAAARNRLLRALGQPGLTARPADAGVQPALERLATALDVVGLAVARADGTVVAAGGSRPPVSGTASAVAPNPLVADGEVLGELRVGAAVSGAPLSARDEELLRLSAAYVAAALRTGRREDEQVQALTGLAEDRAEVELQASTLHTALVEHADRPPGLEVFALGPLRVERNDEAIHRWGGDKAGSRQAQALFAFLLDRGERGVAKDEALELIWPDTDIERADLAFHRTMVGLRQTLDPGRAGRANQAIRFQSDRYRLDPDIVAWSDVAAFLARLNGARAAASDGERLRLLEEARTLYRGDYLDDCPFFGDSVHVEDQRSLLRGRYVDLLVTLGEGYEATGDRLSAGAAFREAAQASAEDSSRAQAGLARLSL